MQKNWQDHTGRSNEAARCLLCIWNHRDSHGWTIGPVTNTNNLLAIH